jgi:hypothetical protein
MRNAIHEEVHPASVGQFTGLKGKNGKGKEIFCSDAIGSFNGLLYEVYWSETAAQWRVRWLNTRFIGKDAGSLRAMLKNHHAIVKGNIHDSPELLGE